MFICVKPIYLDFLFLGTFNPFHFHVVREHLAGTFTISYSFPFKDYKERKIESSKVISLNFCHFHVNSCSVENTQKS